MSDRRTGNMTCIVGLIHEKSGRVYIGADSAATNNSGQQVIRVDQKIFYHDDLLFACASSFRMIQLLKYRLSLPQVPMLSEIKEENDLLFRFMTTEFIDAIRDCFKIGGYATKDNEHEHEQGGEFLVACQGRLFNIASDYQVEESASGYNAVGTGDDLALGALYATRDGDLLPEKRVAVALEAAAYHNAFVRPPFIIKSTPQ